MNRITRIVLFKSVVFILLASICVSWNIQRAQAANFSIQTGYYVGNGATQSITGIGFQPEFVIIKSDTNAGQAVWKSSAMPAGNTAFFSATANNTASLIALDNDGFTVANNANTNNANVRYTWTAFAGSDCSASGTMCIGTYTGNGSSPRKITTGFTPAFVMAKNASTAAANFRSAAMGSNVGQYFTTTAQVTNGGLFTTLVSDGFNVGSTNNTNTNTYYYVAFKAVSGIMAQGTYTGNATDSTSITGTDFVPDLVIVKNATSITAANRNPIMNVTEDYGDSSNFISTATANAINNIQVLQPNGFQVGTSAQVNESGATIYWVAFGGATDYAASGTFQMDTGTYTGTGTSLSISGLGFTPDLVIIKDNAANYAVFRTSVMSGDTTAYLSNAAANFSGGVTSTDSDGFTVGTSTITNTSGNTYQWQAFGGAYSPSKGTGAADFAVGAYYGNAVDNRNISRLPFQPSMVATKRNGASAAVWRSSAFSGDLSSFFGATAETADFIQSLTSDGFQVGTNAGTNSNATLHFWFAFKAGQNFSVGSYAGTGTSQNITSPGFQPDLAWVKRSTAVNGVHRGSSLAGNASQYFANTANTTNRITAFISSGFSVTSTSTETNANGGTYRYATWRIPPPPVPSVDIVDESGFSVVSPGVTMSTANVSFSCAATVGVLGTSSQRLRVTNPSGSNPTWSLSIAATDGSSALWHNGGNTQQFDFNDDSGTPNGCDDGTTDPDSVAGMLFLNPSIGTINPDAGCVNTDVSLSSAAGFQEGILDSLTIASAGSSASTGCYWDITDIGTSQYIPGGQASDTYTLDLTLTITAF